MIGFLLEAADVHMQCKLHRSASGAVTVLWYESESCRSFVVPVRALGNLNLPDLADSYVGESGSVKIEP